MRRVALMAMFGILAVGCGGGSSGPSTSITFYWSFVGAQGQEYGDGTQNDSGCLGAGVESVVVTLWDPSGVQLSPQEFDCEDAVSGVPGISLYVNNGPGTYGWAVDAMRNGEPVYSDEGTVAVVEGDDVIQDAFAAALYADLNVYYDLPTCSGIDRMAIALYEDTTADWLLAYSTDLGPNPPFVIPCGTSFIVPSLPTPADYRVHFLSALNVNGEAVYQVCPVGTFVHNASLTAGHDDIDLGMLATATTTCTL
jgi:hypothetical protein